MFELEVEQDENQARAVEFKYTNPSGELLLNKGDNDAEIIQNRCPVNQVHKGRIPAIVQKVDRNTIFEHHSN